MVCETNLFVMLAILYLFKQDFVNMDSIFMKEKFEVIEIENQMMSLSGVELMSALKEGLKSTGCHVVDIGMVPTPLVYYATYSKAATSGVMITGSHNPPDHRDQSPHRAHLWQ
jgi:hypothetical protein